MIAAVVALNEEKTVGIMKSRFISTKREKEKEQREEIVQASVCATISFLPTAREKRKSQAKRKPIAAKALVDK